ncbi:predicted protein [Naegleria gruberi]|uniref:Predicted protein n=1 Tax=Naegleria gruberi TaxID=5762 RepID=D2VNM1_NAEGR|nr:uncharacterized protein NAEGRDRAFT_70547 [Naegleria gruberi]EFC41431.1 predicted protein [Naegleria gruberi]|eukprot:XP_002674175.1 predicted protein [Naegleria gruberi strain NEG-M]
MSEANIIQQVAAEAFNELFYNFNFDIPDCVSNELSNNDLNPVSPKEGTSANVSTLDESYIDQLIDLELRNVPSSLGLVWSKLSNANEFLFETKASNSSQQTNRNVSFTTPAPISSNICPVNDTNKHQSLSNISNTNPNYISFHIPESSSFHKNKDPKKKENIKRKLPAKLSCQIFPQQIRRN